MKGWLTVLLCCVATLFCGCGGNNTPYVPIGTSAGNPDFAISINQNGFTSLPDPVGSAAIAKTAGAKPQWEEEPFMIVNVTPLHGFSGTVSLTAINVQNVTQFSTNLNPTSVTLSGPQGQTSQFAVALSSSITPGKYTFNVAGTSGGITHIATVSLTVTASGSPSFVVSTVEPSPTPVIYNDESYLGSYPNTGVFQVTVTPVNGFTGKVQLQDSSDQNDTQDWTPTFGPTSVTLDGVHAQTVTFTVVMFFDGDPQAGTYSWAVSGASGSATSTATVHPTLTVSTGKPPFSFTISVSPTSQALAAGEGPITYTVTLTSVNGFYGPVVLSPYVSVPGSILNATMPNYTLNLSANGTATGTVTVSWAGSATLSAEEALVGDTPQLQVTGSGGLIGVATVDITPPS